MVNLVVSLTIRGGPGVFMNVPVRVHRAFNHQILWCGEVRNNPTKSASLWRHPWCEIHILRCHTMCAKLAALSLAHKKRSTTVACLPAWPSSSQRDTSSKHSLHITTLCGQLEPTTRSDCPCFDLKIPRLDPGLHPPARTPPPTRCKCSVTAITDLGCVRKNDEVTMVNPVLVFRLFALTPFSSLHQFLIWTPSFSIYALFTHAHIIQKRNLGAKQEGGGGGYCT